MIDFSKLSTNLKNVLVNIILIPYWYISIYIFHPNLYNTNDRLLILAICFGLTLISSFLTSVYLINPKKDDFIFDENIVIPSSILQSLLLSIIIFLGYLSKLYFKIIFLFHGFLITYFGLLILLLISKKSKK